MKWSFDQRIRRAADLTPAHPPAAELLAFYRELAIFQKPIFEKFRVSGETNVRALAPHCEPLIELVNAHGPRGLAGQAKNCVDAGLLEDAWQDGAAHTLAADAIGRFFSRVLLQPYAEYLASRGDVQAKPESRTCPFCSSWPVAGVLRVEGDGAKRSLLCAVCSTEWPLRRVLCWNCGEENKDKLPIFKTPEFPAVRVDACDNCRVYLKSVDLTKDGHAVPIVDEIASVALDIWAEENGYLKLEANLLGV